MIDILIELNVDLIADPELLAFEVPVTIPPYSLKKEREGEKIGPYVVEFKIERQWEKCFYSTI